MKIQQPELETMMLGLMLVHRDSAVRVLTSAVNADFFSQKYDQTIFQILKELFLTKEGKYDVWDLKSKLDPNLHARADEIRNFGGYSTNNQPMIDAFVDRHWAKCLLIDVSAFHGRLAASVSNPNRKSICDAILKLSDGILSSDSKGVGKTMRVIFEESFNDLEKTIELKSSGKHIGIQTPFKKLNTSMYGFLPGRLYILAARPGVGKTTLALNFATEACKQEKHVSFFSMEMKAGEIHKKIVSDIGKIRLQNIFNGDLNDDQLDRFMGASKLIKDWNLTIFDDGKQVFEDLKLQATLSKMRNKLDIIFIDYLTLLDTSSHHESIRLKVSHMTKELKQMAMNLNIPIVVLAQLNRNIESGSTTRRPPRLSDLKESGSIEQDADVVMFIDRPNMYDDSKPSDLAFIHIEKNRTGVTGSLPVRSNLELSRFSEMD